MLSEPEAPVAEPEAPVAEPDEAQVIGIFGAGRFGLAVARLALGAGYAVRLASSGPIEKTAGTLATSAPGAVAATPTDVIAASDLVVLAVPLGRFRELPLSLLAGHVVIDTMNYWQPADGLVPEFTQSATPTSIIVRDALPATARLVKTLNQLSYHQIEGLARPSESRGRTAIALSGDDPEAVGIVQVLVDRLGFDPVMSGDLRASSALQPESRIFGRNLDAVAMRRLLAVHPTAAA